MYRYLTKLFLAGVAATLMWIVVVAGGPAVAQTADGQTPSEESICDGEVGKAFGFCNAYCEAMDCDSDFPNASDEACLKIEAKFSDATGRDFPCEVSDPNVASCPCTAFSGDGIVAAGLIERAFNDFLTSPDCMDDADSLSVCLNSLGCAVNNLLDDFLEVSATTTLSVHPDRDSLPRWRFETGDSNYLMCEARVDMNFTGSESLLSFWNRRFSINPHERGSFPWVEPNFSDDDLLACGEQFEALVAIIGQAIGELVGEEGFTCESVE